MTFEAVLERAGATIRGRRADCPACGGRQTVALDAQKGLYCCHRYGCEFRGSVRRLAGADVQFVPHAAANGRTADQAAALATRIWDSAQSAPADHPYLRRKGIEPHGARVSGDSLVLAGCDARGTIRTLQFVDAEGGKRFLRGSSPKGCMFPIGGSDPGKRLWIAEGFATAATVHEAMVEAAVAAFSAGNLLPVAKALRQRFPAAELVIAADSDRATRGNPGIAAAKQAADSVGCRAVWPQFGPGAAGTDWNDYAAAYGIEAARAALKGTIR